MTGAHMLCRNGDRQGIQKALHFVNIFAGDPSTPLKLRQRDAYASAATTSWPSHFWRSHISRPEPRRRQQKDKAACEGLGPANAVWERRRRMLVCLKGPCPADVSTALDRQQPAEV